MAESRRGVRTPPPAGAVGLDPGAQGDAAHVLARALPDAGRAHPRRHPRDRPHHRHHRRLPRRDRRPSSSRRSRWWTRSATTTRSRSCTRPGAAPSAATWRIRCPSRSRRSASSGWSTGCSITPPPATRALVGSVQEVLVEGPSRTDPAVLRGRSRARTRRSTSAATRPPARWWTCGSARSTSQTLAGARSPRRRGLSHAARTSSRSSGRPRRARAPSRSSWPGLLGGEIVSCDAMQLYRGLPILTNQPPPGDMAARAAPPGRRVGARARRLGRRVRRLAHAAIDDIVAAAGSAVVCGGSGLYLRAALAEHALPPQPQAGRPRAVRALYEREGAGAAHATLAGPMPGQRRRCTRTTAAGWCAGSSCTPPARASRPTRPAVDGRRPGVPTVILGLDAPRGRRGDARIARRTEAMFAAGVEDEVRAARAAHTFSATAERIHGLQDVTALIDGRHRPGRGEAAPERAHPPLREAPAHLDAAPAGRPSAGRRAATRVVDAADRGGCDAAGASTTPCARPATRS